MSGKGGRGRARGGGARKRAQVLLSGDGRLIGLSKEHGLVKQSNYNFNSHFVKYKDNVIDDKDKKDENKFFATYPSVDYYNIHTPTQNDQTIMNSIDIFMNKTGIDSINYDYINTQGETLEQVNLIKKLNYMIDFKRQFVNKCKNNKPNDTFLESNNNIHDKIDTLMDNISSVGYKSI